MKISEKEAKNIGLEIYSTDELTSEFCDMIGIEDYEALENHYAGDVVDSGQFVDFLDYYVELSDKKGYYVANSDLKNIV